MDGSIMKTYHVCALLLALLLAGCMTQPRTYEDCVLKNISGKTDDLLLETIDSMCSLKFEAKSPPSVSIPMDEVLLHLDGHINVKKKENECSQCGNITTTLLEGYAYNGSEKWVVTELVILIKFGSSEKKYKVIPYYSSLPPLTKRNFVTEIEDNLYEDMKNGSYEWSFTEVRGHLRLDNNQEVAK